MKIHKETKIGLIIVAIIAFFIWGFNFLKGRNIQIVNKTLYGDNVADITVEYANSIKADMISIITEQKSSITNLILGNYAQQVLNKATIPVLNITPREIQIKGSFSTYGG